MHALLTINKQKIIGIIIFLVNFGLILFQRIFREKFLTKNIYYLQNYLKNILYMHTFIDHFFNKLRRTIFNTISTKATTSRYLLSWGVSYQISAA